MAVGLVVVAKLLTQSPGLNAHNRVDDGVERVRTTEDLQSDVVSLQPLAAPSKSFIYDVFQEPLTASRLEERAALEDAVKLLANGLPVGLAIERKLRHASTPNA